MNGALVSFYIGFIAFMFWRSDRPVSYTRPVAKLFVSSRGIAMPSPCPGSRSRP